VVRVNSFHRLLILEVAAVERRGILLGAYTRNSRVGTGHTWEVLFWRVAPIAGDAKPVWLAAWDIQILNAGASRRDRCGGKAAEVVIARIGGLDRNGAKEIVQIRSALTNAQVLCGRQHSRRAAPSGPARAASAVVRARMLALRSRATIVD
jgi:hypothetical protein